jgi:pimeloyl-ACP methyl ester carboxylesterase
MILSQLFSILLVPHWCRLFVRLWQLVIALWQRLPATPKSWMTSTVGSLLFMGALKLSPIHRKLTLAEANSLQDYFSSDWVPPNKRKLLPTWSAWLMAYASAIARLLCLSPNARQDYYALNRQCSFVTNSVPLLRLGSVATSAFSVEQTHQTPILIVPGLNTPPVFFREMVAYFNKLGYVVHVAELPQQGLCQVAEAAEALEQQVALLCQQYNVPRVHLIAHSLGGVVAQTLINRLSEAGKTAPVQTLIALGSGFLGADGVLHLKHWWTSKSPGKAVPKVFDELIKWNHNLVKTGTGVVCHTISTVWDSIVPFGHGFLQASSQLAQSSTNVVNHVLDDWTIDHISMALHPKVLAMIHACLLEEPLKKPQWGY